MTKKLFGQKWESVAYEAHDIFSSAFEKREPGYTTTYSTINREKIDI